MGLEFGQCDLWPIVGLEFGQVTTLMQCMKSHDITGTVVIIIIAVHIPPLTSKYSVYLYTDFHMICSSQCTTLCT